jgi:hypothetical protein
MTKSGNHDILGLLGKPLDAPEVRRFLAATGTKIPKHDDDDVLCLGNEARGLAMELVRAADYDEESATPTAARRRTDWVVSNVDLLSAGANTKTTRAYPHALPFGLAFGDAADMLVEKVGQRPAAKDAGVGYAHAWWFHVGEVKLLAALDARKRLVWLRVVPLDRETARAIARKATLRAENVHLIPTCATALATLDKKRPTAAWRNRATRGDAFTESALADADGLLDAYRENLVAAAKKKSAAAVLAAVKRVVVGFNKLNQRHGAVIETLEREELAAHIEKLARATGYRVPKGVDITAEWRGW